jgi:beta-galactosidase/beta-glucuronidase
MRYDAKGCQEGRSDDFEMLALQVTEKQVVWVDVSGLLETDNVLVVRVHTFSAASYVEDQDEWWNPGIIRSVTLRERPELAIDDLHSVAAWGLACAGRGGKLRFVPI